MSDSSYSGSHRADEHPDERPGGDPAPARDFTRVSSSRIHTLEGERPYLDVVDLKVHFPTDDGVVRAVDGLSFSIEKGQTIGIVGESGSGKSVTSQAILGLHRGTRAQVSGSIYLDGQELLEIDDEELRRLRGNKMAMIFQDPLSAMHPYYTVGNQIVEGIRVHHSDMSKAAAKSRALDLLARVGIPNPAKRVDQYPHEFSGGMRQRAMIALSLANDPSLLIADEPTTALDVTVQAQILDLMRDLQAEFGSAIIMITHDLGVVAEMADDVLVMYGGKKVEYGPVHEVFYGPQMPYTWGLLSSMPRLDRARRDTLDPVPGNPPSLINIPSGCAFHPRCVYRGEVPGDACVSEIPELIDTGSGHHQVRCHMPQERRLEIFANDIKPRL
ncbi:ABC transporter ATP-binding protein [Arsenicicoccus piscis]|uniref:Dipeptide/oligopeptide/nickel ABC transporter ATP-binding protein n=1 Tax=Arsenicicoccus piscis TaxID=673954 RepID=A0ABQ6HL84_9MICO|nr:ABC transporter ATP-binding protein [Arsenicicoccus piscis]MCH8628191.1 ABC transporter ATP-binding protein [Arsenicicoccus piscis]GMA18428.1 dipeptide/oligopeptide/nickel ABC transporter ATP-binding protein [Arsenicicoccus piscis]